jgi:hypothetical protein
VDQDVPQVPAHVIGVAAESSSKTLGQMTHDEVADQEDCTAVDEIND